MLGLHLHQTLKNARSFLGVGGGGAVPVPGVRVIPPGEVVLEHVDA